MEIITNYCGYESGVRNLRKCLDRVFRKIVAKIEIKKPSQIADSEGAASTDLTV
jgi:ATP-dependent Lon protease